MSCFSLSTTSGPTSRHSPSANRMPTNSRSRRRCHISCTTLTDASEVCAKVSTMNRVPSQPAPTRLTAPHGVAK